MSIVEQFTNPLLDWFDHHGRKDLPWQLPRTPYRVWISEIMLQQTQVKTVIPYFIKFISTFPDIQSIANANEDAVLALWSGLGYYSRGRNIYKTACIIHEKYQGVFPQEISLLTALPGIGETTAAAIISQAYNLPKAILDGNVKRVLSRVFMVEGLPDNAETKRTLWTLANASLSETRAADYTQAIMDLGATCCKNRNPSCNICPINTHCLAFKNNCVAEFPFKKIKKTIPQKQQRFLLLHHDGKIFLEKRPPTGLWGGLHGLPIIELNDSIEQAVEIVFGLKFVSTKPLLQIAHSFSHFKLAIHASLVEVKVKTDQVREVNGNWYGYEELSEVGLAKPVKAIIDYFYN